MDLETLLGGAYVVLTGDVRPLAFGTYLAMIFIAGIPLTILTALGVSAPVLGPRKVGPGPKALSEQVAWITAAAVWLSANGGVWLAFHYAEHYYRPGVSYALVNLICFFMILGIAIGTVSHGKFCVDLDDRLAHSPWRVRALAWIARLGEYPLRLVCYFILGGTFVLAAASEEPDMHKCGVGLTIAWSILFLFWFLARRETNAVLASRPRWEEGRVRWTR